jgi:hypothetical protein
MTDETTPTLQRTVVVSEAEWDAVRGALSQLFDHHVMNRRLIRALYEPDTMSDDERDQLNEDVSHFLLNHSVSQP